MYQRHPGNTEPERFLQNPEEGGNCELFTHAITQARGFELPRVRSSELFTDTIYTRIIDKISHAQTGDIIGLCKEEKVGYRGIHMGILWIPSNEDALLIHNARHEGHVTVQNLTDARQYPEHARIAWIKRPFRKNFYKSNPDALRKLGLEHLAV